MRRQWLPLDPFSSSFSFLLLRSSNKLSLPNTFKKHWQRIMLPPILQSKLRCKVVAVSVIDRLHVSPVAKHEGLVNC